MRPAGSVVLPRRAAGLVKGDTAAAMHALGAAESTFDLVSTGGGASLEFVVGKTLPGLTALQDS